MCLIYVSFCLKPLQATVFVLLLLVNYVVELFYWVLFATLLVGSLAGNPENGLHWSVCNQLFKFHITKILVS